MNRNQLAVASVAFLLAVLAAFAIMASRVKPTGTFNYGKPGRPVPAEPMPGPKPPSGLTSVACADAGGAWNECGSACRAAPEGDVCILMCVQYCECASDAQCPEGFSCGDYVDGTGVCKAP